MEYIFLDINLVYLQCSCNQHKIMVKIISILSGIIIFIVTVSTFYYQVIHKPKTLIEVQCLDKSQLTQLPNVEGLSGHFFYNDSIPVKNLWKMKYLLKNIGDINIIGEGRTSNLIGNILPIRIVDAIRILDVNISNNNIGVVFGNGGLIFKQWRPAEIIEITTFVECENGKQPSLLINNRDIVDAEIKYSEIVTDNLSADKKLIAHFPLGFANTLKWTAFVVSIVLYLFSIPTCVGQVKNAQGKGLRVVLIILFIIFFAILFAPFLWVFP